MIYTCYEMIEDCRANRPQGWTYFLAQFVPAVRQFLSHYFPERAGDGALLDRVLMDVCRPDSSLFDSLGPGPERAFLALLRQHVLKAVESDRASQTPDVVVDLNTLTAAFEPLTVTKKLTVWFDTMHYPEVDAARMLRMSAETAAKIRARAAELLRGTLDNWNRTVLADNGFLLGPAAAALKSDACPVPKAFFDIIDGRTTWRGREEMERHVKECWHCTDHYCRLLEVSDMLRHPLPLGEAEIAGYKRLLKIPKTKRSFWKR